MWRAREDYAVDDVASTSAWWMTRRAPVHNVLDDVASAGALWWMMTRRTPLHYVVVDDAGTTGALCGGG